jgi:hypothetical protein
MASLREQIAQHTRSTATNQQQPPQQAADDPLAPKPIRFEHYRDASGAIQKRTINAPTAGWHLEDDLSDVGPLSSPARQPYTSSRPAQQARVTQAYHDLDDELLDGDDSGAHHRMPRSAIRYQDTLPKQHRGQVVLPTPPQQVRRQRLSGDASRRNAPQAHQQRSPKRHGKPWLLSIVTGMLVMTALVAGLQSLGAWWQHVQDGWTYGYPRTFQTDAVVGHNHDSPNHPSHFVALNLRGQVEVFELPAGDPTKARVFLGPAISGEDKDEVVVTLSFADVNHDGSPDMVIHVGNNAIVLLNKGGKFVPPSAQ